MGILELNLTNMDSYSIKRVAPKKEEFCLFQHDGFNLFKDDIFRKYLFFRGDNKSSVNEFWNHFLIEKPYESKIIADCVMLVYKLAYVTSILGIKSFIIFEENEHYLYFTLKASKELAYEILSRQIQKSDYNGEYLILKESVSFKAPKTALIQEVASVKTKRGFYPERLDDESIEELRWQIKQISSLTLLFRFGIDEGDVDEFTKAISSVAATLSRFPPVYEVSTAIKSLSFEFETHKKSVAQKATYIFTLMEAFGQDFERWIAEALKDGKPSVNAFSDMLISNIAIISNYINPDKETVEQELEDIFNF